MQIVNDSFCSISKGPLIELSENQQKATSTCFSRAWNSVYGSCTVEHGKACWELEIVQSTPVEGGAYEMAFGISRAHFDGSQVIFDKGCCYAYCTGRFNLQMRNDHFLVTDSRCVAGDVVSIVLDLDGKYVEFLKNGFHVAKLAVIGGAYRLAVSLTSRGNTIRIKTPPAAQVPSAPTGIASLDVRQLVVPLSSSLEQIQEQINKTNDDFCKHMRRDPAPHFSSAQVKEATQFLKDAMDGMQDFINSYTPEAAENLHDDEVIKGMVGKSRESARKLAMLFGDTRSAFNGSSMKGQVVRIQESAQAEEVRQRLNSLVSFFDTFGEANWLGHVLATSSFNKQQDVVLSLIKNLLSPSQGTSAPLADISEEVKNPLALPECAEGDSISAQVQRLSDMCTKLSVLVEEDKLKRTNMEEVLASKMSDLSDFAEAINRVPDVLKKYVLIRLDEIDARDLSVLKQWVTHDEASEAHRMLEAFRDEANFRRGLRAAAIMMKGTRLNPSYSTPSCEEASMKEYLFVHSIGQANIQTNDKHHCDNMPSDSENMDEYTMEPENDEINGEDAQYDNGDGGLGGKQKPSHRQRKRRGKFWASVPRTPSVATN